MLLIYVVVFLQH